MTVAISRGHNPLRDPEDRRLNRIAGPSALNSGSSAISYTVTSDPASRAAAATSRPIQPPPTTTTRLPAPKAALIRRLSSMVRR